MSVKTAVIYRIDFCCLLTGYLSALLTDRPMVRLQVDSMITASWNCLEGYVRLQFAPPETVGRLSTDFGTKISGVMWATNISYDWFMVFIGHYQPIVTNTDYPNYPRKPGAES